MAKTPHHSPLLAAYELLSTYVSYGAMTNDGQFDDLFEELAGLVPRDEIRPIGNAYRVVVVSAVEREALLAGTPLSLRPREFGSWSRSEDAARRVVRSRFLRMEDDQAVLVVRKPVAHESVVVDVQQVYTTLGFDSGDVPEWGLYASWEAEVILRQDEALLTIGPGDVALSFAPGDLDAVRPLEGEEAWCDEAEDLVGIADVSEEQPRATDGLWTVELDDGTDAVLSWNARQASWDIKQRDLSPSP